VLGRYGEFGLTTYNDRFTAPFWWWLLDQSARTRALWAFHHRQSMDPARYDAVVRSNAAIPGELASLEKVGAVRDAAYVPPDIESADWMTTPLELESPGGTAFRSQNTGSSASFWVALLGGGAFLGWFIFIKRWQV
jgi:hypothetical protein